MNSFLHCKAFGGGRVRLLVGLALASLIFAPGFAQTNVTVSAASASSDPLAQIQQQQWQLGQEIKLLAAANATQAQFDALDQQNAPQLQAQLQALQSIAIAAALQPMQVFMEVDIPADASTSLDDLLIAQISFASAFAQIHNLLLSAMPSNPTQAQVSQMVGQEGQIFEQQYGAAMQSQAQRAQAVAAQSASQPLQIPEPAKIPANASSTMQSFLALRSSLLISQRQLWNQYLGAAPGARDAAMRQWEQQNASQFEQLRQLAQTQSNSTRNNQ